MNNVCNVYSKCLSPSPLSLFIFETLLIMCTLLYSIASHIPPSFSRKEWSLRGPPAAEAHNTTFSSNGNQTRQIIDGNKTATSPVVLNLIQYIRSIYRGCAWQKKPKSVQQSTWCPLSVWICKHLTLKADFGSRWTKHSGQAERPGSFLMIANFTPHFSAEVRRLTAWRSWVQFQGLGVDFACLAPSGPSGFLPPNPRHAPGVRLTGPKVTQCQMG